MTALGKAVPGKAAPVLVLCRQCLRYVFERTITCPHCGSDARQIGNRYREGGYLAIEIMQRIDQLRGDATQRRPPEATDDLC